MLDHLPNPPVTSFSSEARGWVGLITDRKFHSIRAGAVWLGFQRLFSQCLKHTRYAKSVYGKELLSALIDLPASVFLRQWRWTESVVTSLQWAAVTQLLRYKHLNLFTGLSAIKLLTKLVMVAFFFTFKCEAEVAQEACCEGLSVCS